MYTKIMGKCKHGRYRCKQCGIGLCEHGRRKDCCRQCGTGLCEHGNNKYRCKNCGTGYCEHGKNKNRCKQCGIGHCEHDKRKDRCRQCGTGYCEHGKDKYRCKNCGTGYCEHGNNKSQCKDCGIGSGLCKQCKQVITNGKLCMRCNPNGKDKYKNETLCRKALEEYLNIPFEKARPTFLQGLEYDMFNKKHKIACEYNGRQHYEPVSFFGGVKSYEAQVRRDQKKQKLSTLNNITLITVPYTVKNFKQFFDEYFMFL